MLVGRLTRQIGQTMPERKQNIGNESIQKLDMKTRCLRHQGRQKMQIEQTSCLSVNESKISQSFHPFAASPVPPVHYEYCPLRMRIIVEICKLRMRLRIGQKFMGCIADPSLRCNGSCQKSFHQRTFLRKMCAGLRCTKPLR